MLLVIDIGNTNTVMGIYDGSSLLKDWRVRTERNTTEDEFNVLVSSLFTAGGIRPAGITRTVISCVVPPMKTIFDSFCRKYLGHAPFWVDPRAFDLMPILLPNPAEVGADRIVNGIGAFHRYQSSLVVIDFGTATTFDAISERGEYLGGAISPGIMISAEALFQKASKLPRVELFSPPEAAIGKDTASSMQAGIILGYAGLVDGMAHRLASEMATQPKIIATGGLAELMAGVCRSIEEVDQSLTLEGLRIIGDLITG
ncbi:Pantothenate kinase type III, CoaX-like (EC [Olavius algarvensis associated proteobacterium Delta 3]|nr:Pantothenate kinase type III, CoaX-like (EC [Olavius algarvensis associated proteobacterium Delta 3]CAB5165851.1 Pantothenate kinase type III, CoaX-like (EC [Olavius algarvensis associated proteobacterium Delta 3]